MVRCAFRLALLAGRVAGAAQVVVRWIGPALPEGWWERLQIRHQAEEIPPQTPGKERARSDRKAFVYKLL